jgi:hypothetical protein
VARETVIFLGGEVLNVGMMRRELRRVDTAAVIRHKEGK